MPPVSLASLLAHPALVCALLLRAGMCLVGAAQCNFRNFRNFRN